MCHNIKNYVFFLAADDEISFDPDDIVTNIEMVCI